MEVLIHELPASVKQLEDGITVSSATGVIITADFNQAIPGQTKEKVEEQLIQYAFNYLYRGEPKTIFKNMDRDTASITVIRDINLLASEKYTVNA